MMKARNLVMGLAVSLAVLLGGSGASVTAQDVSALERKVEVLERQLRSVQRRVFQGGDLPAAAGVALPQTVTPDTTGQSQAVIVTKISQIERELRNLTGRLEQIEFRQRQLDERMTALESRAVEKSALPGGDQGDAVIDLENPGDTRTGGNQPQSDMQPTNIPATPVVQLPEGDDAAKFAYAFGFVRASDTTSAQVALSQFLEVAADDGLKTNARYWLGKVYLLENQTGRAAEQFLEVFQSAPDHDKAPASLVELAGTMLRMDNRSDACDVLAEFDRAYASSPDRLQRQANAVRIRANCS